METGINLLSLLAFFLSFFFFFRSLMAESMSDGPQPLLDTKICKTLLFR